MSQLPPCPKCSSEYTYEDGHMIVCPSCAHEWSKDGTQDAAPATRTEAAAPLVRDAHGNPLADGDTVTMIKDLKVKGASGVLKIGTRVRDIRLIEGDHNIDCRIDGFGAMKLKSEFVKKA